MSVSTNMAVLNTELIKSLNKQARALEKSTKLSPVFLKRDSFAKSACSTGSLMLDYKIGGGIPPGRIVGIAGPEHSGKSLITTQIAKVHLERGSIVCIFDAEGGNDPLFLKSRGIDFDKYRGKRNKKGDFLPGEVDTVLYYQPETGEQVRDFMYHLMSSLPENRNASTPPIIFILDSVVALVTDSITEDLDSNKMAMHAKMYSEMLPVVQSMLTKTGCSFVYTNQIREKPMQKFGKPTYEPCGSALKFFAAIRLELSSAKPKLFDTEDHPFIENKRFLASDVKAGGVWLEPSDGEFDGTSKVVPTSPNIDKYIYTAVRSIKNKVFNPQKVCWMRIQFEAGGSTGHGLDPVFDAFTFLYELKYIKKTKARLLPKEEAKKKGEKEKVDTIKHLMEINKDKTEDIDLLKMGLTERFSYYDFKKWAVHPGRIDDIRNKLIYSDIAFKAADLEVEDEDNEDDAVPLPESATVSLPEAPAPA